MLLSEIKLNDRNPRKVSKEKLDKLKKSITDFEKMMKLRPIVIDENNIVLGGNMRFKALQSLKYTEVPDEWVKKAADLSEEEKRRFVVADNLGFGEWDEGILLEDYNVAELEEWGYDSVSKKESKEVTEDNYEVPDDIDTNIQLGDMFAIGNHILLCGDSTDISDVKKIVQGKNVDMIFTDPPYKIEDINIYNNINEVSENSNILIFASDKQIPFVFGSLKMEFKRLYVLDTNIASPTNNDVYINHIALLRFKKGNSIKFQNIHNGGRSIQKMDYRKNLKDERFGHKHQKSLTVLGLFINYWSLNGSIVLDLFGGSGSTMASCEQTGRICLMIENNPKNCQIILHRMKSCYNLVASKLP